MNNSILVSLLVKYLHSQEWYEIKKIPRKFTVWGSDKSEEKLALPALEVINNETSRDLIIKSIELLAKESKCSVSEFNQILENIDFDIFQVRNFGKKIGHGRIKYQEGIDGIQGLFSILKTFAKRNINSQEDQECYIDSINMLAPEAGSFIYSAEVELIDLEKNHLVIIDEDRSLFRDVNEKAAIKLSQLLELCNSKQKVRVESLRRLGVEIAHIKNVLAMFSNSSDFLEFTFKWSPKEPLLHDVPTKITFSSSDKIALKSFEKILEDSNTIPLNKSEAYVEGNLWPKANDEGTVKLNIKVDGRFYKIDWKISDQQKYNKIKSLNPKEKIYIDGQLTFITKGKRRAFLSQDSIFYFGEDIQSTLF